MKIGLYDIQYVMNQIKCAAPPSDKESHKLLNNVSILLEKNTNKLNSPLEPTLVSCLEKLHENFLELCFTRSELPEEFGNWYAENTEAIMKWLKEIKDKATSIEARAALETGDPAEKCGVLCGERQIDWKIEDVGCDAALKIIPEIFGKLKKAKSIMEDALEDGSDGKLAKSADEYVEAYLNMI